MTNPIDAAALVARALDIQGSVPPDATPASLPAWDSLAQTRLVLEIEAALGRQLTIDEIIGIDSVAAVARLLAG